MQKQIIKELQTLGATNIKYSSVSETISFSITDVWSVMDKLQCVSKSYKVLISQEDGSNWYVQL